MLGILEMLDPPPKNKTTCKPCFVATTLFPPRRYVLMLLIRERGAPRTDSESSPREEAPAAGACPSPSLPSLPWRPPAPTGGLGEKIGAPPPPGGFRPILPRGRFPPIRRWCCFFWALLDALLGAFCGTFVRGPLALLGNLFGEPFLGVHGGVCADGHWHASCDVPGVWLSAASKT